MKSWGMWLVFSALVVYLFVRGEMYRSLAERCVDDLGNATGQVLELRRAVEISDSILQEMAMEHPEIFFPIDSAAVWREAIRTTKDSTTVDSKRSY